MKNTILSQAILCVATVTIFSGCAKNFGHSSYPVNIRSEPTTATLVITDKRTNAGYSNFKIRCRLFRKSRYQVKLTSTVYAEQIVPINFKLDG